MGLYPKQKLKQAIIFQLKWLLWFQGRAIFLFTLSHFLPDLLFATSYLISVRVPFTLRSRQHSRSTTLYISLIRKLGAPKVRTRDYSVGRANATSVLCPPPYKLKIAIFHQQRNWLTLYFFADEVKVFQSNLKGPKIMGHFSWAQCDNEWRWQD